MSRSLTAVATIVFNQGGFKKYYVQSAVDLDISGITYLDSTTYSASAINIGTIKSRTKITENDSLILKIPNTLAISQDIKGNKSSQPIEVSINYVEVGINGVFSPLTEVQYRGDIVSFTEDNAILKVEIRSTSERLQGIGLRRKFGKRCQHALYDKRCKVVKSAHTKVIVNGNFGKNSKGLSFIDLAPGSATISPEEFKDGVLEIYLDNIRLYIRIANNTSQTLFVDYVPDNLPTNPGISAFIRKGCDLSFDVCKNVFNNTKNFGGFPFFKNGVNPFNEDSFNEDPIEEVILITPSTIPPDYF